MKKLFPIIFFVLACFAGFAQPKIDWRNINFGSGNTGCLMNTAGTMSWVSCAGANYWTRTGTVLSPTTATDQLGIGTTSFAAMERLKIYATAASPTLVIESANSVGGQIELKGSGVTWDAYVTGTDFRLYQATGGSPGDRFTFEADGDFIATNTVQAAGATIITSSTPLLTFNRTGGTAHTAGFAFQHDGASAGSFSIDPLGTGTNIFYSNIPLSVNGAISGTSLNLSGASSQIVLQSAGVTGTITATPATSNKAWTLPNETGTICTTGSVCSGYQGSLTPAALTKTDDTNVTLTLGGTPATALLQATSLTLGWSGQLAVARGGTGAATATANYVFAGPTSGGAAAPSFRALVAADIPTLSYAASGAVGSSGLTMNTARMLGRTTANAGPIEEITIGSGLSLSAGSLTATGSGGTVTSVGLTMPAQFAVANSPITTSGSLVVSWEAEGANTVFAGPSTGIPATPAFRSLKAADIQSSGTTTTVLHGNVSGAATFASVSTADFASANVSQWTNDAGYITLTNLSSSATGLTYTNTTGVFSLTAGYVIPTTTQETNWGTAYSHSQAATGAEHGAVSANTANMIVRRGASGEFLAGLITGTGLLSTKTSADTDVQIWANSTNRAAVLYIDAGNDSTSSNYAYTYYRARASSPQYWITGLYNSGDYIIRDATAGATRLTVAASTGIVSATTFSGALTGNASTATALAANPTDCSSNQFANTIDASGNLTCAALTVAGAQFANQGTTTTVLHGNASGNPSWGSVVPADFGTQTANYVLAGPISGGAAAPSFRALVSADIPALGYAPTGAVGSSGLTMNTARMLGRTTASAGAIEEITIGSGLSLSAGSLTATGSGGTVTSVGLVGTANQITITGASPITGSGSWTVSIPNSPTLPGTTTGTFSGNLTGNVTGTASGNALTGAVGSSGLTMNTTRLLGRVTASAGAIEELTVSGGLAFSGSSLVVGGFPASSTDNAIARWDSTTGKILQNSTVTVDDAGRIETITTSGNGSIYGQTSSAVSSSYAVQGLHAGAISGTAYGGRFTATGVSTTNIGLYASASGATNNYAAIFESGNVDIGTTGQASKLQVGASIAAFPNDTLVAVNRIASATGTTEWGVNSVLVVPDSYVPTAFTAKAAVLGQCDHNNTSAAFNIDCVGVWGWARVKATTKGHIFGGQFDTFMDAKTDDAGMVAVGASIRSQASTLELGVDNSMAKILYQGGPVTSEDECSYNAGYADPATCRAALHKDVTAAASWCTGSPGCNSNCTDSGSAGSCAAGGGPWYIRATVTGHGKAAGDLVNITGVGGCTTINGTQRISSLVTDEIWLRLTYDELCPGAYSSSGTLTRAMQPATALMANLNDRYQAPIGLNYRRIFGDYLRLQNPEPGAVGVRFLSPTLDGQWRNWDAAMILPYNDGGRANGLLAYLYTGGSYVPTEVFAFSGNTSQLRVGAPNGAPSSTIALYANNALISTVAGTGLSTTGNTATTGFFYSGTSTSDTGALLGASSASAKNVYIDFFSLDATTAQARILSGSGSTHPFTISAEGTGEFLLNAKGAANMSFATSNTTRFTIGSGAASFTFAGMNGTGGTRCATLSTTGVLGIAGADCASATPAFSAIASGTNANALLVSGSLAPTGAGTITANTWTGATLQTGSAGSTSAVQIGYLGNADKETDLDFYSASGLGLSMRMQRASGTNGAGLLNNYGTGGFTLNQVGAGNMYFKTTDTARMMIGSDGFMGYGVTTPTLNYTGGTPNAVSTWEFRKDQNQGSFFWVANRDTGQYGKASVCASAYNSTATYGPWAAACMEAFSENFSDSAKGGTEHHNRIVFNGNSLLHGFDLVTEAGDIRFYTTSDATSAWDATRNRMTIASDGRISMGASATPDASTVLTVRGKAVFYTTSDDDVSNSITVRTEKNTKSANFQVNNDQGTNAVMQMGITGSAYANTLFGIANAANYANAMTYGSSTAGLLIGTYAVDKPIVFGVNTAEIFRITGAGIIFSADATYDIGASATQAKHVFSRAVMINAAHTDSYVLNVDGEVQMTSIGNGSTGTYMCWASGRVLQGASACSASSRRFKDDIVPLDFDSSKIYDLAPVSFNWNKTSGRSGHDYGLIAEDVAAILPLAVSYDNGKPSGVRYEMLTPLLIEEIKKLRVRIEKLENR